MAQPHRHQDANDLWDLKERIVSLPRRLQGLEPGASKAEALEDAVLLATLAFGTLLFCVFLLSTFGGGPQEASWGSPSHVQSHYDGSSSDPRALQPVNGRFSDGSGRAGVAASGGSGGGGGGGGGGGSSDEAVACNPSLNQAVRSTSGFRMLTFWRDRQVEGCDEAPTALR